MAKRKPTPKARKPARKDPKGKGVSTAGQKVPSKAEVSKTPPEPAFQESDLVEGAVSSTEAALADFRKFMAGPLYPHIQHPKKRAALWALMRTMGFVSKASRMVKFDRSTYYEWRNTDPAFRAACADIREDIMDLAEDGLIKRIEGVKAVGHKGEVYELPPDTTAAIAVLNNIGASRGYGNKVEVKHTGKGGVILPKCFQPDADE